MANVLEDGDEVEFEGSSSTYTLKRIGVVYSCSCPAWRNQGTQIDKRTCKHLRAYLGDVAETARIGTALTAPTVARAKQPKGNAQVGVVTGSSTGGEAPPVLLAHKWETSHDPTGWWMSEKLDGIRAYWDGEAFVSRLGNKFFAPDWFIADLPADTLDGELWVGRKMFQKTTSIVRSMGADDQWKQLSYVVFDAPNALGGFEQRLAHAKKVLSKAGAPHARALDHVACGGIEHLKSELARVEALGGEGLMLRQPGSKYIPGRSTTLLKVKTFHDAEARVTGHAPGSGKHKGRLGALIVELADGTKFNVGTGFTDAELKRLEERLGPCRRETSPFTGGGTPKRASVFVDPELVVEVVFTERTDEGILRHPSYKGVRIDKGVNDVETG